MSKKLKIILIISLIAILQLGFSGFVYLSKEYSREKIIEQVIADNKAIGKQLMVMLQTTGLTNENPETDSILQKICDNTILPNGGFICISDSSGNLVTAPGLKPGMSMPFNPELEDFNEVKKFTSPSKLGRNAVFSGYAHFADQNRTDISVSLPITDNLRLFVNQDTSFIQRKVSDSSKLLLIFGLIVTFFCIVIVFTILNKITHEYYVHFALREKEILKTNKIEILQKPIEKDQQKESYNQGIESKTQFVELSNNKEEIFSEKFYAESIQHSVLSNSNLNNEIIQENFIFSIPKNGCGGDFYWIQKSNNSLFVAVADCTGHEVAGSLMSLFGINLLNEALFSKRITDPGTILEYIRLSIIETFIDGHKKNGIIPGINMAVCKINPGSRIMDFSGARLPAICISEEEVIELKPNRMPLGIHDKFEEEYSNQILNLKSGDTIYLFTDGFYSQFGGNEGRKFLFKNFKKLLQEIKSLDMDEQKNILHRTFVEWKGNYEQLDDVMVIGLKIN